MNYYIIIYAGSTPGESGSCCKTEYSFENACDVCGTGAEVKGNLKIRGISKTKRDYFETISGDIIISKDLKERITNKLPDFKVEQVVDTKNQPLDFYHLYTNLTLPKFKTSSTGYTTENQCPSCERDGYFCDAIIGWPTIVKPYDFRYDCKDLKELSDTVVLTTWECFGNSNKAAKGNRVVGFARPLTVVREDLKEILESEKIRNLHFEQIKIEGCVQQNL